MKLSSCLRAAVLACAAVAFGALTGCASVQDQQRAAFKQVTSDADKEFEQAFAGFEQLADPARFGGAPADHMYAGKSSEVLARTPYRQIRYQVRPLQYGSDVLARTGDGRYFAVTYATQVYEVPAGRALCRTPGCRFFTEFQALSKAEAQTWFFERQSHFPLQLYRQLFVEGTASLDEASR